MDNVAACWEWDRITGEPVFPHPPRVTNWRYIPAVGEIPELVHGSITVDPVRATDLVRFMHSDKMTFFLFETPRSAGGVRQVRSFMKLISELSTSRRLL